MSLPVDNLHIYILILRPRNNRHARRLKRTLKGGVQPSTGVLTYLTTRSQPGGKSKDPKNVRG